MTELRGVTDETVRRAKESFGRLDADRVRNFIEAQAEVDGPVTISEITYPSGGAGASNGIAFLNASWVSSGEPRSADLVMRYSSGSPLLKQKSVATEFATLKVVENAGLAVPRALWVDPEGMLLGYPGFIMEKVEGDPPSAAMYSAGPLAHASKADRNEMMLQAAGFHGQLRRLAIGADKLPFLRDRGLANRPAGSAIEQELNWWLDETLLVWPEDDLKVQLVKNVREWLLRHRPEDVYQPILVHGDSQIANIMYANGKIAAVLDWELSYLGHVETDLAGIIFLTETMKVLDTPADDTPTEQEYLQRFEEMAGTPVQHWHYFNLMYVYKVISVLSLGMAQNDSYLPLWDYYSGLLHEQWDATREIYGA